MKISYRPFFIIVLLYHTIIFSSFDYITPPSTPERNKRQKYSDFVDRNSVNYSPIKKIDLIFDKADQNGKITTPMIQKIEVLTKKLLPTPNKSRKKVSSAVIETIRKGKILFSDNQNIAPNIPASPLSNFAPELVAVLCSPEVQNDTAFQNRKAGIQGNKTNQRLVKLEKAFCSALPPAAKQKFSIVDIQHVQKPVIKRDRNGLIKQVVGGHDVRNYNRLDLQNHCFMSPTKDAYSVTVGSIPKTVKKRFEGHEIVAIVQDSKYAQTVAYDDVQRFVIKKTNTNTPHFFGLYITPDVVDVANTVFPLLTVNAPPLHDKRIHLGTIGTFNTLTTAIASQEDIYLSLNEFQTMVNNGRTLRSVSHTEQLVDITAGVKNYLQNKGKPYNFPLMYAVIPA